MYEDDSRKDTAREQPRSGVGQNSDAQKSKGAPVAATAVGLVGAVGLLLIKFKSLLFLVLPFLKGGLILAKLGKFGGTLLSMALTVFIYTHTYGLPFALGFVLLIFLHELGHTLMAKVEGLEVSAPMFIPFFGAFIRMKEMPKSALSEAKIALGGPVLGSLAALGCYGVYLMTNSPIFLHLTYTGLFINLFNMIPLTPLDGGRIAGAISPLLWILGLAIAVAVMFWSFSPILLLVIILGVIELVRLWKRPQTAYYEMPSGTRAVLALVYFGLVAILGAGMAAIYQLG